MGSDRPGERCEDGGGDVDVGLRADPRPRIDVALDVAILGARLGGVVVISPDGS